MKSQDERQDQPGTAWTHAPWTRDRINRRELVQRSGVAAVSAGLGIGALTEAGAQTDEGTPVPTAEQYPNVPYPPEVPPEPGELVALTADEASVVEALTARLLPGTPDDPGAREAGVVTYIDHALAIDRGFDEKTYRHGPWAKAYEGDEPPAPEPDVIWVRADQIERYGYQSPLSPLEVYQQGIAAIGRFAQERFGRGVTDLSEEEQDEIVQALADDEADGFDETPFTPEAFFHVLRRHTMEGMFSDPAYGGNRDLVGWRLIGYPGAQRAYTPIDLITEGTDLAPQALADLTHFHPGRHDGDGEHAPLLPVSGSDEDS